MHLYACTLYHVNALVAYTSWVICLHLRKKASDAMDQSRTMELPEPWLVEAPFTRLLLHDGGFNGKSRFHCLDIWHCVHLGIGKSWVASAAMELQKLIPESNLDKRLGVLSTKYRAYCKREGLVSVISKIEKETLGFAKTERTGSWTKASVTSNLMMFLEDLCDEFGEEIQRDEFLRIIVPFLH